MPPYSLFANAPFDAEHILAMTGAYDIGCRDFVLDLHEVTLRKWVETAVVECAHRDLRDRIKYANDRHRFFGCLAGDVRSRKSRPALDLAG